jgi:hypothetical protein
MNYNMAFRSPEDHPPGFDDEAPSPWLLLPPIVVFLISRIAVVMLLPGLSSDTQLYCAYAIKGVDLGEIPYADFDVEYPPVSYWAVCLPRLVSQISYPHARFQKEIPAALLDDYRGTFLL